MGLLATDPFLTGKVNQLAPMVMSSLQHAADCLGGPSGDAAARRWFGDNSPTFKNSLAKDLRRMRSVINVNTISIGSEDLKTRDPNTNAAAWTATNKVGLGGNVYSQGGAGTFKNDSRSIFLDMNFKNLPQFLPKAADGRIRRDAYLQSQLNTLIHELTHLLVGTADEVGRGGTAYGARLAARLAREHPAKAKNNAENWGIFVEAAGYHKTS